MKNNYSSFILSISFIFGLITYSICIFLVDQQLSLLFAVFTFILSLIVLFIYMKFYTKRINKIDLSDIQNISFKDMANCYTDRLIGNGILILTLERLVFICTDNKKVPRLDFMFNEINKITYDKIFKHIEGIKIELNDGSSVGFVTLRYGDVLSILKHYL